MHARVRVWRIDGREVGGDTEGDPRSTNRTRPAGGGMKQPPCFKSVEQYNDYMRRLLKAIPKVPEPQYCWDCTKDYQKKMLEEGKCRHPETTFEEVTLDWDTGVQGKRRQSAFPLTLKRTTTPTIR